MITGHVKGGSQGVTPVWLWKILPPCVSRGRMRVPSAAKEGCCCSSSSSLSCHFGRRLAALVGVGCLVVFKIVVSVFAVLGLRGCVGFSLFAASRGVCGVAWSRTRLTRLSSSSSSSRSYSLAVGCELLTAVAALVLEHRLSSCGAQT